jgi:hypothetical protein
MEQDLACCRSQARSVWRKMPPGGVQVRGPRDWRARDLVGAGLTASGAAQAYLWGLQQRNSANHIWRRLDAQSLSYGPPEHDGASRRPSSAVRRDDETPRHTTAVGEACGSWCRLVNDGPRPQECWRRELHNIKHCGCNLAIPAAPQPFAAGATHNRLLPGPRPPANQRG